MSSHIDEFRSAMLMEGLECNDPIKDDGKLHRFKSGDDKDASAWYVLYPPDPVSAGKFGCWRRLSDGVSWRHANGKVEDPRTLAEARKRWVEADKQKDKDEKDRWERMATAAKDYFKGLKPPVFNHGYFQLKSVVAFGSIVENDCGDLAMPLMDLDGKIWSYQTIDASGDKLFMPGGRVSGLFYPVNDKPDGPLVICEGYATGATIHEATGYATFCAMNCGNLLPVAKSCREKWPDRTILIAADNDRFTKKNNEPYNPGLEKAKQAATSIRGILVFPEFPAESKGSDFNDLDSLVGREAVVATFEKAYPCPLSVLTFEQISKIPSKETDRIFGDHLLDKGSNLVILGQGGTGKTRFVYQMIAAAHLGLNKFLTLDVHPGARNFKWLVLQAENGVERLKREHETLKQMLGTSYSRFNEFVRVLVPISENDSFLNLDNPDNIRRLQRTIEHQSPDGIIFDALYDFAVDDLNKDAGMKGTLTAMSRLARHRNPSRPMIVLHHAGTGSAGAARAIGYDRSSFGRNSKVLYNWSRAQINIAPATGENNDQLIVSCGKCSNGKEFPPFAVRLNTETMLYEIDSDVDVSEWAQTMCSNGKEQPAISPSEVADMASSSGTSKAGLAKRIMESTGCSKMSAYRHIKRAVQKGSIRESGELLFRNS